MEPAPFRPSDVDLLRSFPPLCATFDKTEVEVAAAFLVRVLSDGENTWRATTWPELQATLRRDLQDYEAAGPEHAPSLVRLVSDLVRNPFARPDFHGLVSRGYARWLGEPGGTSPLEFTDAGRERLRRWVRKDT